MIKVLVVEDERPMAEAVAYNLNKEGMQPILAHDGEEALNLFRSDPPNLIILDVMLPSASGFDICRRIRKVSDVPIIMLTARADETDRVVGLELGADDYVVKPFSMRELMSRVKGLLRRTGGRPPLREDLDVECGGIRISPSRREASVDGQPLTLSRLEFELLLFFARNPNRVLDRTTILDRVWGEAGFVGERTVDVHVRWLREKIEPDPSNPIRILTIRGVGYKMVCR